MAEKNARGASNGTGKNGVTHTNGKVSYAEKHKIADHFIGGNGIENSAPSKVKDFVASHDGHTVITNVSVSDGGSHKSRARTIVARRIKGSTDRFWQLAGSDRQQRYRRRQGDPVGSEMGIRDVRRRAGHQVHRDGYAGRSASQRRLHPHGRSLR